MFRTVGHDKAVRALTRALDNDGIAHAYLLAGPPQIGKMTLAMDIARAVNCVADEQPNMFGEVGAEARQHLRPVRSHREGTAHGRAGSGPRGGLAGSGRRRSSPSTKCGRCSARPVCDLPRGSTACSSSTAPSTSARGPATALLKTLEEPPDQVIFVLAATDSDRMLPNDLVALPDLQAASRAAVGDRRASEVGIRGG